MNDLERTAIQDSMQATLEELDIAQAEVVARYMNPILLFMSLAGWGARVVREVREENESRGDDGGGPGGPTDTKPTVDPTNGKKREPIPPAPPEESPVWPDGVRRISIDALRRPAEAEILGGALE